MLLRSGDEIRIKLEELVKRQRPQDPILVAVAFWGQGAQGLFLPEQKLRLLCNLAAGGTNPDVIQDFRKRKQCDVKHNSRLHAKIVITTAGAIVSSANLSANGLGTGELEGGWHEIGVSIEPSEFDYEQVLNRFWELWCDTETAEVSPEDIAAARLVWDRRRHVDPPAAPESIGNRSKVEETVFFSLGPIDPQHQMIRMASRELMRLYSNHATDRRAQDAAKIAGFAANAMWTAMGNEIETLIPPKYRFFDATDVIDRANIIVGAQGLESMWCFLEAISHSGETPPVIADAAKTALKAHYDSGSN